MATRVLPGAYVTLNDLSQVPEGQLALTVGYPIMANRGPVNEIGHVTSPADFLKKYTFTGKPSITDDKTFFSILKVLSKTNSMYVCRVANNPLYGGLVLEAPTNLSSGTDVSYKVYVKSATPASGANKAFFEVSGNLTSTITAGKTIAVGDSISDEDWINGYYIVASSIYTSGTETTKIEITGNIEKEFVATSKSKTTLSLAAGNPLNLKKVGDITAITEGTDGNGAFTLSGDKTDSLPEGGDFTVKGCAQEANNKTFTILECSHDREGNTTTVVVNEEVTALANVSDAKGAIYFKDLKTPQNYDFNGNDLILISGKDAGAYNSDIEIFIMSSVDNPNMVYRKGNKVGGVVCNFDTIQIVVADRNNPNVPLETFLCSRDPSAKTIDGSTLFIDEVVKNSAYITVVNRTLDDGVTVYEPGLAPLSTLSGNGLTLSGGSNGNEVTKADIAGALEQFKDKTVSISLLGNGCSANAESIEVQTALINVAEDRKDCMVFLNNPITTENKTFPSDRADEIVSYKKGDLASTSFYGCMYAPHVNYPDNYNSRTVKIGSEAIALAGWLDVINNLNYPYAYAGPKNGLVTGVTCDWKIGDESGEAQSLNDASVNYIAYDGKVGRYYMQCQNTLQIANSAMRNIGTVLNVLDIKEHFVVLLKEYIQMPITDELRKDILDTSRDYLNPMLGVRFYNYSFQDVTTAIDIADNTLRYLLIIQPTMYAQKIYLTMNIVNATFDFSIVQSA